MPLTKLRIKENGIVVNDSVAKKDQIHMIDPVTAERLINRGQAEHCAVRVRALRAGLFGATVRSVGDEFEAAEPDAVNWHARGRAQVIDPTQVDGVLPAPAKLPDPK